MGQAFITQHAFNIGELSPRSLGRRDIGAYAAGLKHCNNFIPQQSGALERRPGARFISELADETHKARLIDFRFSNNRNYILEFNQYSLRVYTQQGIVLEQSYTISSALNVSTTYKGISLTGHGYQHGSGPFVLTPTEGSTLPIPLVEGKDYYVHIPQTLAIESVDHATNDTVTVSAVSGAEPMIGDELGPYQLEGSGDLPGGLSRATNYWTVQGAGEMDAVFGLATTESGTKITLTAGFVAPLSLVPQPSLYANFFMLAETPGGTPIDITNAGSGHFELTHQNPQPLSISHDYSSDEIFEMDYTQSGDVMYLTHESHPIKRVERRSAAGWTITDAALRDGPYLGENELTPLEFVNTTVTPSATSGTITLTAATPIFKPRDVGRVFRYTDDYQSWGWGKIIKVTDTVEIDTTTVIDPTDSDNPLAIGHQSSLRGEGLNDDSYGARISAGNESFEAGAHDGQIIWVPQYGTPATDHPNHAFPAVTTFRHPVLLMDSYQLLQNAALWPNYGRFQHGFSSYFTTYWLEYVSATRMAPFYTEFGDTPVLMVGHEDTERDDADNFWSFTENINHGLSYHDASDSQYVLDNFGLGAGYWYTGGASNWQEFLCASIQKPAHGMIDGEKVFLTTTGTLPQNLNAGPYFIRRLDADWFYLNKEDGTAATFWDSGSGVISIHRTGVPESATCKLQVYKTLPATTASLSWKMGAFNNDPSLGYPRSVALSDQRLVVASTPAEPKTIFGSATGNPLDFAPTTPDPVDDPPVDTITDANAWVFKIASGTFDSIQWMTAVRSLLAGSVGGLFPVQASVLLEPVTPTNVTARMSTNKGVDPVKPVIVDDQVVYAAEGGGRIRSAAFSFERDTVVPVDMTVLSDHLFEDRVTEMAYQAEPLTLVWVCTSDGNLRSCTFDQTQRVLAWAQHQLGGADVKVESVASIPSNYGPYDELWMVVARTINGETRRYVEMLERYWVFKNATEDSRFLDSSLIYPTDPEDEDGDPINEISGLEHLEGESVHVLGNGIIQGPFTVTSGTIVLDNDVTKAVIGLNYDSVAQTLPLEIPPQTGNVLSGKFKRIVEAMARVVESWGVRVASDTDLSDAVSVPMVELTIPLNTAPALFDGQVELRPRPGWDREGQLVIANDGPYPLMVTELIRRAEWAER